MKIGDLVKYDKSLSGLENCMGLVIGLDGQAIVVRWMDRHSNLVEQGFDTSVELPEFLEVISEGG